MRVLLRKSDNRILESQSNDAGGLDILLTNGKSYGYTKDEIEAKVIPDGEFRALLAEQIESERSYAEKRKANFPDTGDQLDAIWKAITAIHEGEPLPKDSTDILSAIEATKAQFPK